MYSLRPQKVLLKKGCQQNKACWEYLEEGDLKRSRSACVCLTCIFFSYSCDEKNHTFLSCSAHQRLIPQGQHLTRRCPLWHRGFESNYELSPEAA